MLRAWLLKNQLSQDDEAGKPGAERQLGDTGCGAENSLPNNIKDVAGKKGHCPDHLDGAEATSHPDVAERQGTNKEGQNPTTPTSDVDKGLNYRISAAPLYGKIGMLEANR
ncbi:hypothetical protein Y1Q_0009884 [Alligator mississippiensis]|uniref:Uncharacterized protein n=1 Tax=Alligator mississippiensis TaxID=8496 RepID=A0A151MWZ9_ALLMI|nr:hypothetical protein Y1Q_0009884 [Alligator mississippiensis]